MIVGSMSYTVVHLVARSKEWKYFLWIFAQNLEKPTGRWTIPNLIKISSLTCYTRY